MEDESKNKYDFLIYLLGEGDALVCLDSRHPDVDVPKMHKDNPSLSLVFNLAFKRPLDIQPDGIYATLAFSGRSHHCAIPFDAVWAIYDPTLEKGQVWEESLPKDIDLKEQLLANGHKQTAKPGPAKPGGQPGRPRKAAAPKKDRSHLRVIK